MRHIVLIFLVLASMVSSAQLVTVTKLNSLLTHNFSSFEKWALSNGFAEDKQDFKKMAMDMAAEMSNEGTIEIKGKGYINLKSKGVFLVFTDTNNVVQIINYIVTEPAKEQVKGWVSDLQALGFSKTQDSESENGRSIIKAFDNDLFHYILTIYYNGGFMLSASNKSFLLKLKF